ncbi:putative DNA-directed RNA polymerase III RPC4 [Aspergillus clavatus NRRL 1]|uniref:DNA-directed RNA polymerase III RPC4, putative n=1 Tax=Aspergillus clavatus (strain ATCC 1007 / CBS 513.65 / DSM 816 / NCTC 3887 / NRRL 1 / QM 1276 / 107) TaxID=344612 RepID=A1C7V4_ASPCL|nr:DNA-directed RNA polymerase III RPC4, putative [Aspergillus clavatus NRRL 1]EAW14475.1 DNA-directed RNA polymerase III RPC4, putative [Aspergillus clavatus NRRL 1]
MPPKAVRRGASAAGAAAAPRQTTSADASNSSAGSATPTPTPQPAAGTSAPSTRAPVQRLQSLKKRTPSGSIGPSARPAAAGPGPGPGEPAKPALKYKPRAVGRRSKEERDAIEKLEAERNRERLAEVAAMRRGRGNGSRGRGGPGRGRGGPMGGPLGGGKRGRGGRFGPDSRASSISRSRSVIDMGSGAASGNVSSDESDTENLLPIDQIEVDSEEEMEYAADGKKGKIPARYADREKGLRPVRVERLEHEERVVSVNMESSTSKPAEAGEEEEVQIQETKVAAAAADDDALFVRDDDDEIKTRVKEEPVDEDQAMTDAVPHAEEAAATDDEFLPAQKVKVRRRLTPKTPEPEPEPQAIPPVEAPVVKDPKSLLRTKEDIEEYERHAKDLEVILDLLSVEAKEDTPKQPESPTKAAGDSTEGLEAPASDKEKEEADEEKDESKDKLSGQLFLMQFPPMTPNLIVPGTGSANTEETAPEITEQAVPSRSQPGEAGVKRETGDVEILEGPDGPTTKAPSKVLTAADWRLSAGRVGKLNVHKSGRVTMDWGGISFELDRGTAVDFLQEALIVSAPEEGLPEEENRVWAMGQLSGKFTVTPNWEKML